MVTTNVIAFCSVSVLCATTIHDRAVFTTLPPAKPLKTGFPYLIYTCFSFLSFLWLFKWMGSLFEIEIVQPVCITDNYDHIFTKRWNGFVLLLLILCILARTILKSWWSCACSGSNQCSSHIVTRGGSNGTEGIPIEKPLYILQPCRGHYPI